MSSSTICTRVVLVLAFVLTLISSREANGEEKKIQIKVCVVNDDAKNVKGVRIHIVPDGKPEPAMQTTEEKGCLSFEIDATTSFDIAFYYEGQIIGVLRGMAGFENQTVSVNYRRMTKEDKNNAIMRLAAIRSYTESLGNRKDVRPEVIELLKDKQFEKQVDIISSKVGDTTHNEIQNEIKKNVQKLPKR